MVKIDKVTGSKEASAPLIMNVDTIYVHTNVQKVTTKNESTEQADIYEYTERQYTYEEYKENHAEIAQILVDDANDAYTLLLIENGVL
jgi:hypothetical protein|nr:MAG TPA: hypothetical protein [Caudoviricetes sp.]